MACYDVVVLGAGIQGSSTACYLVRKAGLKKVLLLEQFTALHSRGSSHGRSRITRRAYHHKYYVKMMNEAFKMWSELEELSNTQLYIQTGILAFGSEDVMTSVTDSLESNGISHETFSASEANERYSNQISVPSDFTCVFEEDGGILQASEALAAYQKLFVSAGGELRDEHPVTEIVPGDVITIKTTKGDFKTKKLVITAGAWTPTILKTLGIEIPMKILRAEVLYWKVDSPEDYSLKNFPVLMARYTEEGRLYLFYGLPIHEYPGLVKIFYHSQPSPEYEIEPDDRDANQSSSSIISMAAGFVKRIFKGVASTPSIVEPCMYTESPDENPVLDRHTEHSNIIIGTGFSGHGFKLSPVIGKILSELALDQPPSYNLSPFRLSRFDN